MVTTTFTATYQSCGASVENDVVVTPQMCGTISGSGSHIDCFGASTGTASVTITDGIAPFVYCWSNGSTTGSYSTTNTISNLVSGIYVVTVSSLDGNYQLVDSFLVSQNDQIFVYAESFPESFSGASDGFINVSVTNGIAPFVYSCTGQPDSQPTFNSNYSFEGLVSGSYNIAVNDTFGCQGIDSVIIQTTIEIEELKNSVFSFYPNPANDLLSISLNDNNTEELYLYDSVGKLITVIAVEGSQLSLDLEGLKDGVYFIKTILDDGRVISKSFIILK